MFNYQKCKKVENLKKFRKSQKNSEFFAYIHKLNYYFFYNSKKFRKNTEFSLKNTEFSLKNTEFSLKNKTLRKIAEN